MRETIDTPDISGKTFARIRQAFKVSQSAFARAMGRADRGYSIRLEASEVVTMAAVEQLGKMIGYDLTDPAELARVLSEVLTTKSEAETLGDDLREERSNQRARQPDSDRLPEGGVSGGGSQFVGYLRDDIRAKDRRIAELESALHATRVQVLDSERAGMVAMGELQRQMTEMRLRLDNEEYRKRVESDVEKVVLAELASIKKESEGGGMGDILSAIPHITGLIQAFIPGAGAVAMGDRATPPPHHHHTPPPPPQQQQPQQPQQQQQQQHVVVPSGLGSAAAMRERMRNRAPSRPAEVRVPERGTSYEMADGEDRYGLADYEEEV